MVVLLKRLNTLLYKVINRAEVITYADFILRTIWKHSYNYSIEEKELQARTCAFFNLDYMSIDKETIKQEIGILFINLYKVIRIKLGYRGSDKRMVLPPDYENALSFLIENGFIIKNNSDPPSWRITNRGIYKMWDEGSIIKQHRSKKQVEFIQKLFWAAGAVWAICQIYILLSK